MGEEKAGSSIPKAAYKERLARICGLSSWASEFCPLSWKMLGKRKVLQETNVWGGLVMRILFSGWYIMVGVCLRSKPENLFSFHPANVAELSEEPREKKGIKL